MPITCSQEVPHVLASAATFAEIDAGLHANPAAVAPKYFYDPLGSKLFEAICELPEYYPTRTEAALATRYGAELARAVGPACTFIDLGAGNCAKAATLFPLLRPVQYVAVDISHAFLRESVERLQQRFEDIDMLALGMDFSELLELPGGVRRDKRLFYYPGSSIGNFTPEQAGAFLRRVHGACGHDGALLIGIDLVKDAALLNAAYDDDLGLTAAFNLNVLRHLNHLIGADFDTRQWRHLGFYNAAESRVEMHLEAREDLTVCWNGSSRRFAAGERIHTENSYKYTRAGAVGLLEQSGFRVLNTWVDPNGWFALVHARSSNG